MRVALAIGLCLLTSAAWAGRGSRARVERAPRVRRAAPRSTGGQIQFLTQTTAFLDKGEADGVKVGDKLSFFHGGRAAGSCVVEAVTEHSATCPAGALRKGDLFTPAHPPEAPVTAPPPLADEAELARRHAHLADASFGLVDFEGGQAAVGRPRFTVAVGAAVYSDVRSANGPYQAQVVDARVYDVDVWKGIRVSADLSVLTFTRRPPPVSAAAPGGTRSPLGSPTVLVRQLEVGFRRDDFAFFGSIGRTWLKDAPGLLILDGVQAGWKSKEGDLSAGVFAGLVPSPINLTPVLSPTAELAAGVFASGRLESGHGAQSSQLQVQARLDFANRAAGARFEGALGAQAFVNKYVDANLALELGYGAAQGPGGIDAARLDFGLRPSDALRIWGGAHYIGTSPTEVLDVGVTSAYLQQSLHADLGARWEATETLWLGLTGDAGMDLEKTHRTLPDGTLRSFDLFQVGPELTLPRLLGPTGGLSLGYLEELGWLRGRSGYVQLNLGLLRRVRLLTRLSWYQPLGTTLDAGLAGHELGGTVTLDWSIWRWLWLRAVVTGRAQLSEGSGSTAGLTGGQASIQLGGTY